MAGRGGRFLRRRQAGELARPLLYIKGCRLRGIYLTGVNQDVLSLSYRKSRLGADFLKIPIFVSSGINDNIAPPARAQAVVNSLKGTGFRSVRFEMFPQGHAVKNDHTIAALRWFRSLRNGD
jgi:hypothetical protein